MLIKKKKVKLLKHYRDLYKNLSLFAIILTGYSISLVSITLNKDKIINNLPRGTKQIIINSIPYQYYKSGFKANILNNLIKSGFQKSQPIILDIKYKDYIKLEKKRNHAVSKGVLITKENDYVDAIISDNEVKLEANIRLKGDWTDHLAGNKWSYRVKIKDDKTFLGMRKFSLQSPSTRNYLWEWVYHKLLKKEGLPALRYQFKPLIVNGNYLGIYAIEEHFDKILLESNSFKEAPIIKLSEDLFWKEHYLKGNWGEGGHVYKSYSKAFNLNKIKKDELQVGNLNTANQLLNGFLSGELTASEVFDIELLSRFLAISDLTNGHHGSEWHNMRFYYDPFQSKLIPIGFDGDTNRKKLNALIIDRKDYWRQLFFNDRDLTKKYINSLNRISEIDYLDKFFKEHRRELEKNRNILYKSFPALSTTTKNYYINQKRIKEKLNPIDPLNIFIKEKKENMISLMIGNNQNLNIEVIGLGTRESGKVIKSFNEFIEGRKDNQATIYKQLNISLTKEISSKIRDNQELDLIYRIDGMNNKNKAEIKSVKRDDPSNIRFDLIRKDSILSKIKYLNLNNKEKVIEFKRGRWEISKPLIIPKNYKVIAKEGVKLIFKENGLIISKSPIKFIGTENKPIIIESSENNKGNGFIVVNAKSQSKLNNVKFRNLDNINRQNWEVSGAVTFYQSPVEIRKCSFENSFAEDSLNIVRSDFSIADSNFLNSTSDALDIDFSDGEINNLAINNSKNDGLDISGSYIKASNITIENSLDKGISIGEDSSLSIKNLFINKAFVGLAIKDGSELILNQSKINNVDIDIVGFQKKSEYDSSSTKIMNHTHSSEKFKYLLGEGSTLSINNIDYKTNSSNSSIFKKLYINTLK